MVNFLSQISCSALKPRDSLLSQTVSDCSLFWALPGSLEIPKFPQRMSAYLIEEIIFFFTRHYLYQLGFSRVTELMGSLYIINNLLMTYSLQSSSQQWFNSICEWKSKDLAVTQSHMASSRGSKSETPFFRCPQQKVQPRLKLCSTTPLIPDDPECGDLIFGNPQPLCLKISIPRSRSETSISHPPDKGHW